MLKRKVEKSLSFNLDSRALVDSVEALGEFYVSNTEATRRSLSAVVAKKNEESNKKVLETAEKFESMLNEIGNIINTIDQECVSVADRLRHASIQTESLLQHAEALQNEKSILESKIWISTHFMNKFQLSPDEQETYNNCMRSSDVSQEFFRILEKLAQIRNDSRQLLKYSQQKLGMEILERTMEMLENGLEKVYKWALREIRFVDFDRDVQPSSTKEGHSLHEEISIGMLIQVLSCLRQRQTYLEHCCEEIIIHRRVSLVSSFLSALTSEEGEFGNSRPIEIYAHDPVRYISDMLAWLHQTIASEKDLAVVLFGDTAKNSSPTIDSERSSPKETLLEYYSSKCIDALIRPLQSRIEQVLSNSSNWNKDGSGSFHGFVTAYQIYSVIKFYHKTILSLISKESSMVQALETFANDALRSFFELVQFEGSVLLEQFSIPDETLAPSNSITLYISQISDLFGVFEASLLQSNASVERNDDASFILNTVLDPIMKAIANTASILRLDDSSQKVYHINVLCAVQFVLRKFLFAQTKVETLSLEIDTLLRELIELQVSSLLERFGVSHKLEIINNHDSGTRLCDIEGMDSNSLRISIQKFYQSLSMLSSFSGGDFRGSFLPLCDRLQLQQLRIAARQGVAKALSDTYSSIFEAIHDPGNGYSDPESIFKHSPVQFSTLLEI